ncbi:MAG TPA: glycoside hydrolase family 5 protein [Candidatus Saccharimonadales bacterium]|jgi:glucan 1,3-beta-glucosidase
MFFKRKRAPVSHPPLRGVNLGGWLVLEKWITPGLFGNMTANDEYSLCTHGGAATVSRIRKHRDTFITKDDFVWLKANGIDAVRLPVGYWTFGDEAPYMKTIEYVDNVFAWAAETGLFVLLDMHAAPGSQNGWDHSGRSGVCGWHTDEQNIIKTLTVVGKLAKRYARHPQLLGIELLNEPKWTVPRAPLLHYYEAAYQLIRKECGPNVWVVFSDNFRPRRWKRKLTGNKYSNMLMDTHQYQTFNKKDKKLDITGHIDKTLHKIPRELAAMRRHHSIIVGEWSLALDPESLKGLDAQQVAAARRAYGATQLLTYSQSSAWFYWTYRTESSPNVWSFRDCVEQGWL